MTDQETYGTLLHVLWKLYSEEDLVWESNYRFVRSRTPKQIAFWWTRAQIQARKGNAPMQTLVGRFIAHQLTR